MAKLSSLALGRRKEIDTKEKVKRPMFHSGLSTWTDSVREYCSVQSIGIPVIGTAHTNGVSFHMPHSQHINQVYMKYFKIK